MDPALIPALPGCCARSYLYLSIMYNICYTMALYALVLFYLGAADLLKVRACCSLHARMLPPPEWPPFCPLPCIPPQ
jgi:hypothetical protein